MDEETSAGDPRGRRYRSDLADAIQCIAPTWLALLPRRPCRRSAAISEATEPSFQGRSLFDALAMFRRTIEPAGGRLLQAMASRECWADAESRDRFCRRLTLGSAESDLVDGFLPIDAGEAASSISVLNLSPLKLML